ncbi:MAG: hypothetical protein HOO88_07325 [Kiritimatiellaceae bacterium]|nr:hypothetical protein [Kiritimatiellaceae bacterium]
MKKRQKIGWGVVVIALAVVAYKYFFGYQTSFAILVRHNREPWMDIVPKPMAVGLYTEPVTKLKAFDYSFSVPWPDCSQPAWMVRTSLVAWACSGSNVTVVCFAPTEGLCSSIIPDTSSESAEYRQAMIKWLGMENVTLTNSHIFAKAMEVTPGDFSPFGPRREAAFKFMLFLIKTMCMSPKAHEIYSFDQGDIKGFQFGNPSIDRRVNLCLFDRMDREVEITIGTRTNSPVRLTQADINTIITTFSSEP